MRENMGLYRGKRIDGHRDNTKNGTMLYGSLFIDKNGQPKIKWYCEKHGSAMTSNVDPETVGQYTGFHDSTKWEDLTTEEQQAFLHQPDGWENTPEVWPGKRIFEGDILQFADTGETGYEYKEGFDFTNRAAVVWENGRWELGRFLSTNSGVNEDMTCRSFHEEFILVFGASKVIGNIHDDPGLLLPWDGDDDDDSPF